MGSSASSRRGGAPARARWRPVEAGHQTAERAGARPARPGPPLRACLGHVTGIGPVQQQQGQTDVLRHIQVGQHVERLKHKAQLFPPPVGTLHLVEAAQVDAVLGDGPLFQSSSAAMQLSRLDLPTPDSPTMATNSPGATLRFTWLKTRRGAIAFAQVGDHEAHVVEPFCKRPTTGPCRCAMRRQKNRWVVIQMHTLRLGARGAKSHQREFE